MAEDIKNNEVIVEEGVSDDVMDRIKRMQEENNDSSKLNIKLIKEDEPEELETEVNLNVNNKLDNEKDSSNVDTILEEKDESNEDETVEEKDKEDDKQDKGDSSDKVELSQDTVKNILKDNKITEEQLADQILKNKKFPVKIKGKDVEVSYDAFMRHFKQDLTHQQMYNKLRSSEEVNLGNMLISAKSGDKTAQKEILDILKDSAGKEDFDDYIEELEGTKEKFDKDKNKNKLSDDTEFEIIFADVKNSVDFDKNINTIKSDVKQMMPELLWNEAWESPANRRAMYDLVASGTFDAASARFQAELLELPLAKRVEIESNLDSYGSFLSAVVDKMNAEASKANKSKEKENSKDVDEKEDNGVSSVSNGTNSKSSTKASKGVPDFAKMSSKEFKEFQEKNGLV